MLNCMRLFQVLTHMWILGQCNFTGSLDIGNEDKKNSFDIWDPEAVKVCHPPWGTFLGAKL